LQFFHNVAVGFGLFLLHRDEVVAFDYLLWSGVADITLNDFDVLVGDIFCAFDVL
jgi:hypothetical protein